MITITVSDGVVSTNRSFQLSIVPNSAPTISAVSNVTLNEDQSPAPISFTIQDLETATASLVVTANSSNQALITDQSLTVSGNGSQRNVAWTPVADAYGSTVITLSLSDGTTTTTTTFTVTVNAVNDTPLANDDVMKHVGVQGVIISPNALLSNDNDLDGDSLQWAIVSQPTHGRLELVAGSLKYILKSLESLQTPSPIGSLTEPPGAIQPRCNCNSKQTRLPALSTLL